MRRLGRQGFRGSLRVVTEWATRRRRAEKIADGAPDRTPSARTIARLMTITRDRLSRSETVLLAAIERSVLPLVEAREIIAALQGMIKLKLVKRQMYSRGKLGLLQARLIALT